MTTYDKGDVVRLSATFGNVSDVATDPTTVILRVKNSAGTTVYTYAAAQISRDSAGNFHKDLALTVVGEWSYRWEGTGAVETAGEARLFVRPTRF